MSQSEPYLGYLIRRLHQQSSAIFAQEIAKAGVDLTPRQFAALSEIRNQGNVDQARLAEFVGCDRATMGGIVERLEKKGLVVRNIDPSDRRARLVSLTPEGGALLDRAEPVVSNLQTRIVSSLNDEEQEALKRLLMKTLPEHITEME